MPVHSANGGYQWGSTGKIYHGDDAKKKAIKQGLAVAYATGTKPELECECGAVREDDGSVTHKPSCTHFDVVDKYDDKERYDSLSPSEKVKGMADLVIGRPGGGNSLMQKNFESLKTLEAQVMEAPKPAKTFGGGDIARCLDDLRNRFKATIKGISVTLKHTPGRKYDHWDLYINDQKVWSVDSAEVPVSAGGSVEAYVRHALDQAGYKRAGLSETSEKRNANELKKGDKFVYQGKARTVTHIKKSKYPGSYQVQFANDPLPNGAFGADLRWNDSFELAK